MAAIDAYVNLPYGIVVTPPAPATTGTSLTLTTGHGARFPAPPFNLVVWPVKTIPDPLNAEIVRVTALVSNTLTIVRAQESTTARAIVTGDQCAAPITRKTLDDLRDATNLNAGTVAVARLPVVTALSGYPGGVVTFLRADGAFAAPPTASPIDLDYSGDYVPGTYNDGDIVIGADGIAYLCVKNGVTTPPEPWPGMGIASAQGPPGPQGPKGDKGDPGATGATVADATYWTSSAHGLLTAEQNFGVLAGGYVKTSVSAGVAYPVTVGVIPVVDGGTGASDVGTARTNLGLGTMALQNANAVAITGGTFSGGTFAGGHTGTFNGDIVSYSYVRGGNSLLHFVDPTGPVDGKVWRFLSYANSHFYLEGLNDAQNTVMTQFMFGRDGNLTCGGAGISNLNASNLATGTVPLARLPVQDIFPSGLMVLSLTPCPPGWTRIVWDGYFLRVGPTPGVVGGAWDHTHGVGSYASQAHVHSDGSYSVDNHNHGGSVSVSVSVSGNTSTTGDHSHYYSGSGTTDYKSENMNSDAGNDGLVTGPHDHDFNYDGWTNSEGNHSHSFSGSGSGSGSIAGSSPGVSGQSGSAGSLAITGASAAASSLPPFVDIFVCKKN